MIPIKKSDLFIDLFIFEDFTYFFERGGGREKEREGDIDQLPLVHALNTSPPGTKPRSQSCALTRNQTGNIVLCGMRPNEPSHRSQGKSVLLDWPKSSLVFSMGWL